MIDTGKRGRYGLILAVVCMAEFMGSLDVSAVLLALPSISDSFGVTTSISTWVIMSYGLIMASFMLIFGKLGDRLGYRRIVLTGLILFTASSLMCGLAGSIIELIAYRVAQGVGAAMLASLGPAIVSSYFPPERRGAGLGYVTTFASLGLAVGPVVGGLLIQYLDWRWIFLVNVPVGVVGIVLGYLVVPQEVVDRKSPFDITGAVLAFLTLLSLIFCLNMGEELEWDSLVIWASGIAAITFGLLFSRHLKRAKNPLLDVRLMKNPNVRWANWSALLVLATASGAFVLLPFYFQYVKGWNTESTGLALLVPALAMVFAGPVAGYLSDRRGCRAICVTACVVAAIGFFLLSFLSEDTSLLFIVTGLIVLGFSVDMFLAPNHSLVMSHTDEGSKGTASALMMTMQDTGEVLGVVVFESIFSQFIIDNGAFEAETNILPANLIPGFQAAFLAAVAISVIALLMSARARDASESRPIDVVGGQGTSVGTAND